MNARAWVIIDHRVIQNRKRSQVKQQAKQPMAKAALHVSHVFGAVVQGKAGASDARIEASQSDGKNV